MAITFTFNGQSYTIPSPNDPAGWAQNVNTYLLGIAAGAATLNGMNTWTSRQTFSAQTIFNAEADFTVHSSFYSGADVTGGLSSDTISTPAATITSLTATNSALGTVNSGIWHGAAIGAGYLPAISGLSGSLNLSQLAQGGASTGNSLMWNGTTWIPGAAGTGSVQSVALSLPGSIFQVSGSPVTVSGTLTGALVTQNANTVWAGPTTGAAAGPTFRQLIPADVSGLAASATTDTTNAANISSGVLASGRIVGAYTGLTGLGTITSGVWNGTALTATYVPALSALSGALALNQLAQGGASPGNVLQWNGTVWAPNSAPAGTVTSVALSAPSSVLSVSGSPVTGSGTLALALATSTTPNQVLASATSGTTATALAMRALVAADIPTIPSTQVSGLAASATTDTTNATNIASGTLPAGRLTGSYTGITGVGTLTAGAVPASLVTGSLPFSQVSGTVPTTQGGTGTTTYTLGDTLYSSAANTLAKLAGNITTAKQFLTQTGTGSVSAAPAWAALAAGDIPTTLNATTFPSLSFTNGTKLLDTANGTLQITTSGGAFGTLLLGAAGATTGIQLLASNGNLAVNGGTGAAATVTAGGFTGAAGVTSSVLMSGGTINVKNPTANSTQFGFISGSSGLTQAGLRFVASGQLLAAGDETASGTVPASIRQSVNVLSYSAAQTLTATLSGSVVFYTAATTAAITLPTPALGLKFTVIASSTATAGCTVTTPSGSIFYAASTGATRSLTTKATLDIVCDGTNWYAIAASGGGSIS